MVTCFFILNERFQNRHVLSLQTSLILNPVSCTSQAGFPYKRRSKKEIKIPLQRTVSNSKSCYSILNNRDGLFLSIYSLAQFIGTLPIGMLYFIEPSLQ